MIRTTMIIAAAVVDIAFLPRLCIFRDANMQDYLNVIDASFNDDVPGRSLLFDVQALVGTPGLVDGGLILECRDVAHWSSLCHSLEKAPHYLPAPGLGQLVDEEDLCGLGDRAEPIPDPFSD